MPTKNQKCYHLIYQSKEGCANGTVQYGDYCRQMCFLKNKDDCDTGYTCQEVLSKDVVGLCLPDQSDDDTHKTCIKDNECVNYCRAGHCAPLAKDGDLCKLGGFLEGLVCHEGRCRSPYNKLMINRSPCDVQSDCSGDRFCGRSKKCIHKALRNNTFKLTSFDEVCDYELYNHNGACLAMCRYKSDCAGEETCKMFIPNNKEVGVCYGGASTPMKDAEELEPWPTQSTAHAGAAATDSGTSIGLVVGISVGSIVGLAVVAAAIYYVFRRKKSTII